MDWPASSRRCFPELTQPSDFEASPCSLNGLPQILEKFSTLPGACVLLYALLPSDLPDSSDWHWSVPAGKEPEVHEMFPARRGGCKCRLNQRAASRATSGPRISPYFKLERNSTRFRKSDLLRNCSIPSGIADRPRSRLLMSATGILISPSSGEFNTSSVSVLLFNWPA